MTTSHATKFYQEPGHEEIALNAFLLWEKEGRQPGREMTYWLQAEDEIRTRRLKLAEAAAVKSVQPWPPRPATRATAAKPRAATRTAVKTAPAKTPKLVARLELETARKPARSARAGFAGASLAGSGQRASRSISRTSR